MIRRLLLAASIVLGMSATKPATSIEAAGSICPGYVVYTWGTKYPTCNVQSWQTLNVYGISRSTCLSWGGSWAGYVKLKNGSYATLCRDVDF